MNNKHVICDHVADCVIHNRSNEQMGGSCSHAHPHAKHDGCRDYTTCHAHGPNKPPVKVKCRIYTQPSKCKKSTWKEPTPVMQLKNILGNSETWFRWSRQPTNPKRTMEYLKKDLDEIRQLVPFLDGSKNW